MATLQNEVRDLYGQPYIDGGTAEFRQRSIVGEPVLAFYGREVVGVYQNDAQVQADPVAAENNLVPGDLIYKDQNNDGIIDDDDRVVLGSYLPSLMYGFNFGVNYRKIQLTANFMGQAGNKILNRKRGEIIWTPDFNMDADLAKNRWHGEGTSNNYPSSAGLRKGWNQKMSDYFVEDGSFFRIQNVQLSYTFDQLNIGNTPMPAARINTHGRTPTDGFQLQRVQPRSAQRNRYPDVSYPCRVYCWFKS